MIPFEFLRFENVLQGLWLMVLRAVSCGSSKGFLGRFKGDFPFDVSVFDSFQGKG